MKKKIVNELRFIGIISVKEDRNEFLLSKISDVSDVQHC